MSLSLNSSVGYPIHCIITLRNVMDNARRSEIIERMRAASVVVNLQIFGAPSEVLYHTRRVEYGGYVSIVAQKRIPSGTPIYKGFPLMSYNNVEVDRVGLAGAIFCLERSKLNSLMSLSSNLYPHTAEDMGRYMDKKYANSPTRLDSNNPVTVVYARTDHNAFSLGDTRMVVYSIGSSFNHSCIPNCYNTLSVVSSCMVVVTARDIEEGEECTITYNIDLVGERDRRKRISVLETSMFFTCECEYCSRPVRPTDSEEAISYYTAVANRSSNTSRCEGCDTPACTLRCAKCTKVYYCSRECQLVRWPAHKRVCTL